VKHKDGRSDNLTTEGVFDLWCRRETVLTAATSRVGLPGMAKPLRLEFSGATHHVMARGNQGQKICIDDHDLEMWLAATVQAWKPTGWLIHAWVLMGNHYYLLLETPEQAVSLVESSRKAIINEMKSKLSRCDTWTREQKCQLSDRRFICLAAACSREWHWDVPAHAEGDRPAISGTRRIIRGGRMRD
jgi:REP element-mobilizing transposase RayT